MVTNSESTPISTRDLLAYPDFDKFDLPPRGRDKFSSDSFLKNLKFALKNRKFMSTLIGTISLWSVITNPLNTPNPTPFFKNMLFGPKVEIVQLAYNLERKLPTLTKLSPGNLTHSIKAPVESGNLKPEISKTAEEIVFNNFSVQEKANAEEEITEQIKIYKNTDGKQRAERVLDWEETTLKPILKLDVPAQDRKFWSDFLSAVVYVESGGVPSATSEVEIVGLAQISEATAAATARQHGITNFDLRKGWDSLRLSRFHLQDLMERYKPDISLLGYYGGQGLTDRKILAALQRKGVPITDSIIAKGISSNEQLNLYVNHYQVNIFNLGSEDGKEYFRKFVAALRILKEARKVNLVQTTN